MNFLTQNLTIQQLLELALNAENNQNIDSVSAAIALIQANKFNLLDQPTNMLYEGQINQNNNKARDQNTQNQISQQELNLMNTKLSSNLNSKSSNTVYNNQNQQFQNTTSKNCRKTGFNSSFSNSTQKSQNKSYTYQQNCPNSITDQNILQNISTNLNSFFEKSSFNSEEKKILSPSSSNQISQFVPHIILNSNDNKSEIYNIPSFQQQLPEQQQDFSLFGNLLNAIDPTLQSLISQYGGIDTKDYINLNLQKRLERQIKIERYKNKRRNWIRKISYDCRKKVADARLRVKGRFISKKDSEKLKLKHDESSDHQENNMSIEQQTQIGSHIKHDTQNSQDNHIRQDGCLIPSVNTQFHNSNHELQQHEKQQKLKQNNSTQLESNQIHTSLTQTSNFNIDQVNPHVMEKIKKRIKDKKHLFSLISSKRYSQE